MLAAAAVARIASLLILAWDVAKMVRGAPSDPSAPACDRIGEVILRGFIWMLMIGVGAAFAISLGEALDALRPPAKGKESRPRRCPGAGFVRGPFPRP